MKKRQPRQKIYIYPNRYGLMYFLCFGLMILVGGTYTNNLIFLMAFSLISLLLVGILITARNIRGIEITSVDIEPGFPGELTRIHVTLSSTMNYYRTKIVIGTRQKLSRAEAPVIAPHDRINVTLPFRLPETRGIYQLDRIRIATENPFGLFYCWSWWRKPYSYYVFPKPNGVPLPARPGQQEESEFSGFKTFEPSDSPSRISWKHYARTNELLVKEFRDAEVAATHILWSSTPQTQTEDRLSQMAKWLLQAEESQQQYQMQMPGFSSSLGKGPRQLETCLIKLAEWEGQ